MNKLVARWHCADTRIADHLAEAHGQLAEIPGLEGALAMVDAALAEVSAWERQRKFSATVRETGRL